MRLTPLPPNDKYWTALVNQPPCWTASNWAQFSAYLKGALLSLELEYWQLADDAPPRLRTTRLQQCREHIAALS